MSRTKLTYCGNFTYSIWRQPDESKSYYLDEHDEMPYEVSVFLRYISKIRHILKKEEITLTVEADELILHEDEELRMSIDSKLQEFGRGKIDVETRKKMVDNMMKKIRDKGVGYSLCYCDLDTGPKIVIEIVELLEDVPPPPVSDD